MKYNKLSISIVSAFIAALGLTACSNVTPNDKSIVTLTGYDGNRINIDANAIYNKYKVTEDGISSFYQAILEVMIRNYFETSDDAEVKSSLEQFKISAKNDVAADKEDAREKAETNDTSYDTEWEAILEAAGVEDEEGLYQKHLYSYEKTEYEDKYFETNKAALTSEFIGFTDNGESVKDAHHESMYPYHIRHILVKTSASATDYVTGEITSAEAQRLNTVYEALANGRNTFGQVAYSWSEDTSASTYGDAGIMTTTTSFVNEFKLGIYAYDCVYGVDVTGTASKTDKLGLNGSYNEEEKTVKQKLEDIGLATVPFAAFKFLGDNYDKEKSDAGLTVNDGVAKYYPRNIIWNNYLNLHNVFVITDESIDGLTYQKPADVVPGKTGFRTIDALTPIVGAGTRVLTDEDGRVIIGVRSEYGIHFMITERTPFEISGTISGYVNGSEYSYDNTTINEYYTTYKPGDPQYPQTTSGVDKITYVNFMKSEESTYSSRAKTVEDSIKGFDEMYDYRIFEELVSNKQIQINDAEVADAIDRYIVQKRQYNEWNADKTLNDSWNSYLDKIALQYEIRGVENGGDLNNSQRLVKVTCGINFGNYNPNDPLWKEGGACYYEK